MSSSRRFRSAVARGSPFKAEEYAFKPVAGAAAAKGEMPETLYWNPLKIAGADGRVRIDFDLRHARRVSRAGRCLRQRPHRQR